MIILRNSAPDEDIGEKQKDDESDPIIIMRSTETYLVLLSTRDGGTKVEELNF